MNKKEEHLYDDIIDLPHHVSNRHPQMPMKNRAAQFAPFAALTGHSAAIKETARLTNTKIELDEYLKVEVNDKILEISDRIEEQPVAMITYFLEDKYKTGGKYFDVTGVVKKIDKYKRTIVLMDERIIPIDNILEIRIL